MHRMCLVKSQKVNPWLMLDKNYTVVGELSYMDSNSDQVSLLMSGLKMHKKVKQDHTIRSNENLLIDKQLIDVNNTTYVHLRSR